MTKFDSIKSKNIDELAEWLDKYAGFDDAPWTTWFDMKYCKDCEPEIARKENTNYYNVASFGWCELHGKCKYFQELEDTPDNKQVIKMWLESES